MRTRRIEWTYNSDGHPCTNLWTERGHSRLHGHMDLASAVAVVDGFRRTDKRRADMERKDRKSR